MQLQLQHRLPQLAQQEGMQRGEALEKVGPCEGADRQGLSGLRLQNAPSSKRALLFQRFQIGAAAAVPCSPLPYDGPTHSTIEQINISPYLNRMLP
jgi:hypothetical protein